MPVDIRNGVNRHKIKLTRENCSILLILCGSVDSID